MRARGCARLRSRDVAQLLMPRGFLRLLLQPTDRIRHGPRIVVGRGTRVGPLQRRALREMPAPLPDSDQLEDAVREYLDRL